MYCMKFLPIFQDMFKEKLTSRKWMTFVTVLVVMLSALLYKPIPEGVLEPWKARQAVGLLRFIGAVAYGGQLVGIGTFIPNTRIIVDTLSLLQLKFYDGLQVEDSNFGGTKVRLYIPKNPDDRKAAILFVHGGGWLICSVETHDHIVSEIARRLNVMVVSVDYHLCPENPYPVPLQDSLNAHLHFVKNAARYGVDPRRIAIVGDSAGGNMAAALTQKLRGMSDQVPQPRLQNEDAVIGTAEDTALVLLSYMGVDMKYAPVMAQNNHTDAEVEHAFYELVGKYLPAHRNNFKQNRESISDGPSAASSQLTELVKPYLLDPFCFPLMQKNLTGLPKTYIATAEHDPLRDDGILYAKRLKDADIDVTLVNYADGFHGILAFFQYPIRMTVGVRMIGDLIDFLDANL